MKKLHLPMLMLLLMVFNTHAQLAFERDDSEVPTLETEDPKMGEELPPDGYDGFNSADIHDELTVEQRDVIWQNIHANSLKLKAQGIIPQAKMGLVPGDDLRYPLKLSVGDFVYNWNAFYWNSNFVDENAAAGAVLDYNCGNRTYDIPGYNHQGQDIALWPFSWNLVAGNYAQVVAAAGGWITFKQDGNFDMNCGFGGGDWNAVYLEHPDGSVTWYGHMKNGSLTAKPIGAWVNRGEYLGVVASSGQSTGPHLHFEVYDAAGNLVDPNAGPCNGMGGVNWWKDPKPYYYSKINAIYTHCAPPTFMACPNLDITNICDTYYPGSLVYFFSYFTETLAGQHAFYQIYKPDGTLWNQWTYSFPLSYMASYWYWSFTLPAGNTGIWTFKVKFKGKLLTYYFNVINPLEADGSLERVGEDNRVYWMNDPLFENASFTIEKSQNQTDITTVASINGLSMSAAPYYSWTDPESASNTQFYRITTTFNNGQTHVGQWLAAKNTPKTPDLADQELIYPVPATNQLMVMVNGSAGNSIRYSISNASGQLIQESGTTLATDNLLQLSVSDLANGMYFLTIVEDNYIRQHQFVKQ